MSFIYSLFLLFMPSWCGGISYQEWLKYMGWFFTSTMIGISNSFGLHQQHEFLTRLQWISARILGLNFGMFLMPWEITKNFYLRQLGRYNAESTCNMWPSRRCAAIDNGPPPTIHDPSNDTFYLVEVDEFHGSKAFVIFDPIRSGVD